MELCPSAENGQQLLQLYRRYRPDVIFRHRDAETVGIDAAWIREDSRFDERPLFVFTTAYGEYAVQAFDLEAVDYLLALDRNAKAMRRVRKRSS